MWTVCTGVWPWRRKFYLSRYRLILSTFNRFPLDFCALLGLDCAVKRCYDFIYLIVCLTCHFYRRFVMPLVQVCGFWESLVRLCPGLESALVQWTGCGFKDSVIWNPVSICFNRLYLSLLLVSILSDCVTLYGIWNRYKRLLRLRNWQSLSVHILHGFPETFKF